MSQYSFKKDGVISDGGSLYRWIDTTLKDLEDGDYTISIDKAKKRRSLDQNALFHLWCRVIAKDTGASVMDVKDYFKTKFLMRENPLGGGYIVGSTSSLKVKEFTHFMNEVQAEAASEFGIKLLTPEDLMWGQFLKEVE